ncbi:MAG TPA: class I SAM-dependent DNA methyltransferase, partial [Pusillimonas sp.]|nr:class I SAM-dependent DNA methyltransferase [Pusillimonas sp.]
MATINQAEVIESLQTLATAQDNSEFIFSFMGAYGYPKATITQLRNGHSRNVAADKASGEVALKKGLYFKPVASGQSIFDAADQLATSDVVRSNAIRFIIVTDFADLVAIDL